VSCLLDLKNVPCEKLTLQGGEEGTGAVAQVVEHTPSKEERREEGRARTL
jgi:hypothetical protein